MVLERPLGASLPLEDPLFAPLLIPLPRPLVAGERDRAELEGLCLLESPLGVGVLPRRPRDLERGLLGRLWVFGLGLSPA